MSVDYSDTNLILDEGMLDDQINDIISEINRGWAIDKDVDVDVEVEIKVNGKRLENCDALDEDLFGQIEFELRREVNRLWEAGEEVEVSVKMNFWKMEEEA